MKASQPPETPSLCPRHPRSLGLAKGGETKELSENNQRMGEGMNHQEEALRSESPEGTLSRLPYLQACLSLLLQEARGVRKTLALAPGPALLPSLPTNSQIDGSVLSEPKVSGKGPYCSSSRSGPAVEAGEDPGAAFVRELFSRGKSLFPV